MITTSDGIKAYVAKRDFLSITSEQIIRDAMLSYSDDRKGSRYADVTQMCGETIFVIIKIYKTRRIHKEFFFFMVGVTPLHE